MAFINENRDRWRQQAAKGQRIFLFSCKHWHKYMLDDMMDRRNNLSISEEEEKEKQQSDKIRRGNRANVVFVR